MVFPKNILLLSLLVYVVPSFSTPKLTQEQIQKAYAASLLGSNLCFLEKGKLTRETFVLNVENLMLKKGYDLEILRNNNVQKAGKLIQSKLSNDCADESIFRDENFLIKIFEIIDLEN